MTRRYISKSVPLDQKFWKRVRVLELEECWEWQACRVPFGYGRVVINSKWQYAHRLAYELVYGDIPEGLFVCHKCDNPPCCNPNHLFLGTAKDNTADRDRKGRGVYGKPKKNGKYKYKSKFAQGLREMFNAHVLENHHKYNNFDDYLNTAITNRGLPRNLTDNQIQGIKATFDKAKRG